jgi:hypothetical protein
MVAFERAVIEDAPPPWLAKRRPFDENEDRAVMWAYRRGWTLKRIASQCGRHWGVVQARVNLLIDAGELRRRSLYNRPWTAREDAYLRAHFGLAPDAEIVQHLGRTLNAIHVRAARHLKLCRKDNFLTMRATARIFGVDDKTPLRWAERGWVSTHRGPFKQGPSRVRVFPEAALRRFIETMPWAYDWRRMKRGHWLTELARQVDEADPWLTCEQAARDVPFVAGSISAWCDRGILPFRRRPKQGRAGPREGMKVFKRSDLMAVVASVDERTHENRSRASRAAALKRFRAEAA